MNDFSFSYPRYLEAKESIDQRSLSRSVWSIFLDRLSDLAAPVDMLEVGGGTGATLRRFLREVKALPIEEVRYTLVDSRGENVETAEQKTDIWAEEAGFALLSGDSQRTYLHKDSGTSASVTFREADLFTYVRREAGDYDAVLAQAVLDLYDIHDTLHLLGSGLKEKGLWYLPIHFDGLSVLEPPVSPALDRQILRCYHDQMRSPQAGRKILTALRALGNSLLEVASSDWIVHSVGGEYRNEDEYFLMSILSFIEDEIDKNSADITAAQISDWVDRRRRQVASGDLIYIAHQLDICAEKKLE